MTLIFTLDTSLVKYKSKDLNETCKAKQELTCIFYDDKIEEVCNTGSLDCLDHLQFQDDVMTKGQFAEYSSLLGKAIKHTDSAFWCAMKAIGFATISYFYNNLVLYKQKGISDTIQEYKQFFNCNKNLSINLSEALYYQEYCLLPLSGSTTTEEEFDLL